MSALSPDTELALLEEDCRRAGVLAEFQHLMRKGCAPRAAAMFALRQPPGHRGTEKTFFEGRFTRGDEQDHLDRQEAEQYGVVTTGKVYVRGLARPGLGPRDKKAWVSDTHDIVRRAKELNVTVEGCVNHKARQVEPVPDCPLAEKHVRAMMKKESLLNGMTFNKLSPQEKREHVIEKYGNKRAIKKWNEYQRRLKRKKKA